MSLMELLSKQLDDRAVQQIGGQLGLDPQSTSKAVSAALPMLLGALAKNSNDADGAKSLASALDRDHDGSVLDDVVGFLGQGQSATTGAGSAILKHILGGRRGGAEQALGQVAGINSGQAGQLMSMLAPLVMGALAKQKKSQGMDSGALAGMLTRERQNMDSSAGSLLSNVLDRDGDGNVADDIAELGAGLLGSFLKKR